MEKEVFSFFFFYIHIYFFLCECVCVDGHTVRARINKYIQQQTKTTDRSTTTTGLKDEGERKERSCAHNTFSDFLYPQGNEEKKVPSFSLLFSRPSSSSILLFSPFFTPPRLVHVRTYVGSGALHRRVGWLKGSEGRKANGVVPCMSSFVVVVAIIHPSLTHLVEPQSLTGRRSASTVSLFSSFNL